MLIILRSHSYWVCMLPNDTAEYAETLLSVVLSFVTVSCLFHSRCDFCIPIMTANPFGTFSVFNSYLEWYPYGLPSKGSCFHFLVAMWSSILLITSAILLVSRNSRCWLYGNILTEQRIMSQLLVVKETVIPQFGDMLP